MVGPTDIWAVGLSYAGTNSSPAQTLTEHWDGTAWSIIPGPGQLLEYGKRSERGGHPMIKLILAYRRYALAALATVGFWVGNN